MTSAKAIVHVIDDDASFLLAVGRLLDAAGYTAQRYASAGEFLLKDDQGRDPGCGLLDLEMPGPGGAELHEALNAREMQLPVIFLTGQGDIQASVSAMKRGAVDFLTKPVERETLLAAIETALAQDLRDRGRREKARELVERYASLSTREQEVLRLVVLGRLNKQIAGDLGMAERTVKAHRANAMAKLKARSLAELVTIVRSLDGAAGRQQQTR